MAKWSMVLTLCMVMSLGLGCKVNDLDNHSMQSKTIEILTSDNGMIKNTSSNSSGIKTEAPSKTSYPVYKIQQNMNSSSAMDSYKRTYFRRMLIQKESGV